MPDDPEDIKDGVLFAAITVAAVLFALFLVVLAVLALGW